MTLLLPTCPFRQMSDPLIISHSLMQYAEIAPFCLKLQIYLKYKFTVGEGNRLPLFLMFDLSKVSLHFS